MGWGYGVNAEGREIGYLVRATCDHPGCKTKIDRGLSYACGGMHDHNEYGCGDYFCPEHLYWHSKAPKMICAECLKRLGEDKEEGETGNA